MGDGTGRGRGDGVFTALKSAMAELAGEAPLQLEAAGLHAKTANAWDGLTHSKKAAGSWL